MADVSDQQELRSQRKLPPLKNHPSNGVDFRNSAANIQDDGDSGGAATRSTSSISQSFHHPPRNIANLPEMKAKGHQSSNDVHASHPHFIPEDVDNQRSSGHQPLKGSVRHLGSSGRLLGGVDEKQSNQHEHADDNNNTKTGQKDQNSTSPPPPSASVEANKAKSQNRLYSHHDDEASSFESQPPLSSKENEKKHDMEITDIEHHGDEDGNDDLNDDGHDLDQLRAATRSQARLNQMQEATQADGIVEGNGDEAITVRKYTHAESETAGSTSLNGKASGSKYSSNKAAEMNEENSNRDYKKDKNEGKGEGDGGDDNDGNDDDDDDDEQGDHNDDSERGGYGRGNRGGSTATEDEQLLQQEQQSQHHRSYDSQRFNQLGGAKSTKSLSKMTESQRRLHIQQFGSMRLDKLKQSTASQARLKASTSHGELLNVTIEPKEDTTYVPESEKMNPHSDHFDLRTWLQNKRSQLLEYGYHFPQLGVSFKKVKVIGEPVGDGYISTVLTPVMNMINPLHWINKFTGAAKAKANRKLVLNEISGFVRPGEMLLVLGRPGSGCSSLLRTLAAETRFFKEVQGSIEYNQIPAKEFVRKYKGEVNYNPEDDEHFPTLTVRQTLQFALECKIAGQKNDRHKRKGRINEMLHVILRSLGLMRCADTLVGDATIRGVSGGEKKRLSIGEMMCNRASLGLWDGSTKGLDASSALDFVRALRICSDNLGYTNVVSVYQASESIYELFDRVLVLSQGRCIFFGPVEHAKEYFESLGFVCPPRKTTADFLTSITEKHERQIRAGFESKVPNTAEEFAARWNSSSLKREMDQDQELWEADCRLNEESAHFKSDVHGNRTIAHGRKLQNSIYVTTVDQQMSALIKREFNLTMGSRATLIGRYVFNAVMAVIVGSVFYDLPLTASGAFSRGGAMFFSLLFNTLTAQQDIPKTVFGRSIIYKQKSFAMYHPALHFLARWIVDIPLSFIQVLIFSAILYNLSSLQADGSKFFIFVLAIFVTNQCFGSLVRLLSSIAPDLQMATQMNGSVLISFLLYTGYTIPVQNMIKPLFWIFWINPVAYGFKVLMINEYSGLKFLCNGVTLVPSGAPIYSNPLYQTCTMAGSVKGQTYVDGAAYIQSAFSTDTDFLWPNVLIIFAMTLALVAAGMAANEWLEFGKGGSYATNVFKKQKLGVVHPESQGGVSSAVKATKPMNDHDEEARMGGIAGSSSAEQSEQIPLKSRRQSDGDDADEEALIQGESMSWLNLKYTVPNPAKGEPPKVLLNEVTGYVEPKQMVALMGSSGAGKTTLLDTLALRKTNGKIEGDIFVGDKPQDGSFRRISAYCEQMDVHLPNATVREALRFSADLRQPPEVSQKEKYDYVEKILRLLEMEHIADALIGQMDKGIGISIEQRKRLTIGIELVARPSILFLDEPTSGLDSQASFNIVRLMRNLANSGQAIVCTIHQPSAILFQEFDKLLLLARGGKVVYFGDIGDNSNTLLEYFEKNGANPCGSDENPAEYILDQIGAGIAGGGSENNVDWPEVWKNSPEAVQVVKDIQQRVRISRTNRGVRDASHLHREYALPLQKQIAHVMWRMLLSYWRDPGYNFGRVVFMVVVSCLLGFTFFQQDNSIGALQNRVFVLFQCTILGVVLITNVQPEYMQQRTWFRRETASGFYNWSAFAAAVTTVEIPFTVIASTIFFVIYYNLIGLGGTSDQAGFFYLVFVVFSLFAVSLGQMIASFCPTLQLATLVNPIMSSFMSIFAGVTQPYSSIPAFWKNWAYWVSVYHYFVEAVAANELWNLNITCAPKEIVVFDPDPLFGTCGAYMAPYLTVAPGQLLNPSANSSCMYCPMKIGKTFVENLDWSFDNRYRNLGILVLFFLFNRVMTFYFIRKFKANKR